MKTINTNVPRCWYHNENWEIQKNGLSDYPKYIPANIDGIMGYTKREKKDSIIQKFMVPTGYQNEIELRHKGSMCTYVPTCCSFLSLQTIIVCSHY